MKVAVIQYSTYGHITTLARAVQKGVEQSGLADVVDLFQVPETLSPEVLQLLHAPEKPSDIPVATIDTLAGYDALLLGIPTRFGSLPAQWVEFWGQTGGLWTQGALYGKPAGIFVSTGTPGGGQELTVRNSLSYLAHHGLPYIPLGYSSPDIGSFDEVHGGSPWGAGTYAGADGSRQPNNTELRIAEHQGKTFAQLAKKIVGDGASGAGAGAAGGKAQGSGAAGDAPVSKEATGAGAAGSGAGATDAGEPGTGSGAAAAAGVGAAGAGAAGAAGAAAASKDKKNLDPKAQGSDATASNLDPKKKTLDVSADDKATGATGTGTAGAATTDADKSKAEGTKEGAAKDENLDKEATTTKEQAKSEEPGAKLRSEQAKKADPAKEKSEKSGCAKCIIM
ncbi:NAD(P)H quinone oxidoreductase Ycp4p [Diutina catenulata]